MKRLIFLIVDVLFFKILSFLFLIEREDPMDFGAATDERSQGEDDK